jgi:gluconolactonase
MKTRMYFDEALLVGAAGWVVLAGVCGCGGNSTPPTAESGDASLDASGDASTKDAASPPLKFSDIGQAVLISNAFYFTEGPVWDPKKNVLYFSDINAHQGRIDGGVEGGVEAGAEASVEGGIEAGAEGGVEGEGGAEAGIDGGTEGGVEGGVDGGMEGGAEAGIDGGVENGGEGGGEGEIEGGVEGGVEGPGEGVEGGVPSGSVGGAIYRLTLPNTIDVLFQPDGNADGLGLDPQGNILAAGFAARSAWRLSASNTMETLAPCAQGGGTCYAGQEVNTPDDITSRSDGVIYFTDPTFGSASQGFPALSLPLAGAQGVYRLTTDGTLHLEDKTTSGPNGVNLSPDEKSLYVSYTLTGQVAKFDVAADGSLSNKKTFATGATLADSMCVDAGGNVYVGTFRGLAVYDPAGEHLGTIPVGGDGEAGSSLIVTNCAFGGPDQNTLFITARTSATLAGAPPTGGGSLYQITNMPVRGIPGQN